MSLVSLLVLLLIVGAVLYVINTIAPIDPKIKTLINVVVVIAVCLMLLDIFVVDLGRIERVRIR